MTDSSDIKEINHMANKLSAKSIKKWISDNAIIVMILLAAIFTSTQNKNF